MNVYIGIFVAAVYGCVGYDCCAGCDWFIGDMKDGRAFICVGGSACNDGNCETHVALIVCFDWATVGFWVMHGDCSVGFR